MKQTEKVIRFICVYADCKKETEVIIKVARALPTQSKDVAKVYYCEHCNRANKIEVPDNIDKHIFILGKDKGFIRYTNEGIPLLQGEMNL
ncbi:hypothetical protein KSC_063330 [Ktedonobacter sp. SOSP1-52]|uniref:hypothetical protein n=1 Tax=Ktedonobacter sp. SOSP1-52 TaxID=2778366 RepID=UPI0019150CD0|nr:hypothetical protein [Ktedonobacter sp. SOSP1-52]GHO67441.1 hypothetical protein KSC_063330 [Ktedonobacter sp. SOSP1-52]